jgi:cobalt/nickel transport protein
MKFNIKIEEASMKRRFIMLLTTVCVLTVVSSAFAHFMMVYTPEIALEQGGDLDVRILFTHPATAGHMMDMGGIEEFYVMFQRGDSAVKKIDLKGYLKEIEWANPHAKAPGFAGVIPKKVVRSMGDYVFVMKPGYYFEKEEGAYMQQITKLVMNVGGVPGNWGAPVGLPCEIVPLIKPYGLWTGNVFKAQVLSDGKPVAGAEVEVEYMSHMPDLATNSMPEKGSVSYPHDAFVTQTIHSDVNGYIVFGIPKAGWWGFAALGVGPKTQHDGKDLSQDAVIWVKAVDMQ